MSILGWKTWLKNSVTVTNRWCCLNGKDNGRAVVVEPADIKNLGLVVANTPITHNIIICSGIMLKPKRGLDTTSSQQLSAQLLLLNIYWMDVTLTIVVTSILIEQRNKGRKDYSKVPMSILGWKTGFWNSVTEMYRWDYRNGEDNGRAVVVEPADIKNLGLSCVKLEVLCLID